MAANVNEDGCWSLTSRFPFFCLYNSVFISFYVKVCGHEKLLTLILKPHETWNDSFTLLFMFSRRPQNWALHVLFFKEDDGKIASWLRSHVKLLLSVVKSNVLLRSRSVYVRVFLA